MEDGIYQRPQAYFEWLVPDEGFIWKDKMKVALPKKGEPQPKGPFLMQSPDTTRLTRTFPLEESPHLFTEFAKLGPDEKSILEWASLHGNLEEGVWITPTGKKKAIIQTFTFGVAYGFWQGEITEMSCYLKLWEALERKDKKALAEYIEWEDEKKIICHFKDIKHPPEIAKALGSDSWRGVLATADSKPDLFRLFVYPDTVLPARHLLQREINEQIGKHGVIPRLLINNKAGLLDSYLMPQSLIAAMWLQFYYVAAREWRFKMCPICGRYENVTGRREDWTRHEKCAAKIRARKSYQENKKTAEAKPKAAKKPTTKQATKESGISHKAKNGEVHNGGAH